LKLTEVVNVWLKHLMCRVHRPLKLN